MEFPTQLSFFGITLHLYGMIIGLAVVVGWQLVEKVLKKEQISEKNATRAFAWMFGGVIVGARLWHVATDWRLYQNNLTEVLYVWNGGLSILGAIFGGFLALGAVKKLHILSAKQFWQLTDALVLGLPVAQAIGRGANWVNQELYGLPTDLPWKLFIGPEHRLPGYEQYAFYHPLFAYEVLGSAVLAGYLWFLYRRRKVEIGQGVLSLLYVLGYGGLRFLLDFLRIDKRLYGTAGLGVNQVVLLVLILLLVNMIPISTTWKQRVGDAKRWFFTLLLGLVGVAGSVGVLAAQWPEVTSSKSASGPTQFPDRKLSRVQVGQQALTVEIVDTPEKITQGLSGRVAIGADGMLFIFEQPRLPGFWMKDMQFDLDLVWIAADEIVGITAQVPAPPPGAEEYELPIYYPPQPVSMVLEVPAGFTAVHNWQVGDAIVLDKPGL